MSVRIPCRRCLLAELDPDGMYRAVQKRVAQLSEDERTDLPEYQRRIAACTACSYLNSGTCGLCGCFVELRAAKKQMNCPHTKPKW